MIRTSGRRAGGTILGGRFSIGFRFADGAVDGLRGLRFDEKIGNHEKTGNDEDNNDDGVGVGIRMYAMCQSRGHRTRRDDVHTRWFKESAGRVNARRRRLERMRAHGYTHTHTQTQKRRMRVAE